MNKKILIIYGSNNGATKAVVEKVSSKLSAKINNIYDVQIEELEEADVYIFASSTWGHGDLCDDWENHLSKIDQLKLKNKFVAFIGLGDQYVYGSTFCNAISYIYHQIKKVNFKHIGLWPLDGYEHDDSESIVDNKFMGLTIDEDNQAKLTDARIEKWVSQLEQEFSSKA